MFELFIQRLSLIGGLASLVLAALWPHAKPLLDAIRTKLFLFLCGKDTKELRDEELPVYNHPKLGGYSLKRRMPDLMMIGQRRTLDAQSLLMDPNLHEHEGPNSIDSITQQARLLTGKLNSQSQSPISLNLFAAAIIALVVFAMMKLLLGKVRLLSPGGGEEGQDTSTRGRLRGSTNGRSLNKSNPLDRRKLSRMSRDERARQLILRHGSKNVSKAIRFLITELDSQKQQLLLAAGHGAEAGEQGGECACSCHCVQGEVSLGRPRPRDARKRELPEDGARKEPIGQDNEEEAQREVLVTN